jgi:outer membrane autotransporter protein
VNNFAGGTISGAWAGVQIQNAAGSVTNAGYISSAGGAGVTLSFGGSVVNQAGATIHTEGNSNVGVHIINGASRSVENAGIIESVGGNFATGIEIGNGDGSIVNHATGSIYGTYNGIYTGSSGNLTITNAGTISSLNGPTIEFRTTGTITNTGTIENLGGGNAITFGGTHVRTLNLGTGSQIVGNVVGGVNGTDNLVLQGTGTEAIAKFLNFETLTMQGTAWSLTGNSTFATSTTVEAGNLNVAGELTSPAIGILAGGTLSGIGTLIGNVTNSGTIAPGNSIGTLSVTGNASFGAASSYEVEIRPGAGPGDADFLDVSGTVTITAGATAQIVKQAGLYTAGTTYHILHAGGGVTGTFTLAQNLPFLSLLLIHDPDDIYLQVQLSQFVGFTDVARTPNQRAAAAGAESLGPGNAVFDAISNLNENEARRAFDQVSGEIHASLKGALIESWRYLRNAVTSRLRSAEDDGRSQLLAYAPGMATHTPAGIDGALWMQAYGAWGKTDGDGNAASLDRSLGGAMAGVDRSAGDWRVGLAGGFHAASLKVPARSSTASTDTFQIAAYAGKRHGPLGVRLGASVAHHEIETARRVSFPGFSEMLTADYSAWSMQAFAEAGYRLQHGSLALEPFAALALVHLRTGGFSERDGSAALSAGASRDTIVYSTLGVRAAREIAVAGIPFILRGSLAWRHAFGGVTPDRALAFAAGSPFTVAGVPIARNAALVEAGISRQIAESTTVELAYSGKIAADAQDHSLKARLASRF